jgi:predicted neuraminidase
VSIRGIVASGFINENAPYPQCHASTIVETAAGELVAAWFGGTKERAPDVGIWVARQEKGQWLPAVEVANGVQPDGTRLPTWNPVLFQPGGGPLVLFYKVGPSPREWWGMWMTSEDGGRRWSPPYRLPEGILGPIKNKPVVLPDGSWLSPSSTESPETGWQIHFERSNDGGQTWKFIGPVEKNGYDAIQPSILCHPDGRLQAVCRSRNSVLVASWSEDGGDTWSPLTPLALPNPNSGTDAVTLADGHHLLIYNHSAPPPERPTKGVRYPLDLALSDNGIAWRRVRTLESEPCESGYAYPAIIQAADGTIHITYTWNRERIKHIALDPTELIEEGLSVNSAGKHNGNGLFLRPGTPARTANRCDLPAVGWGASRLRRRIRRLPF